MDILELSIKPEYLDAILEGRKRQESREVRPTTAEKLVECENGFPVYNEDDCAYAKWYDAIRFTVVKEKRSVLVQIDEIGIHINTHTLLNSKNLPILFEADDNGNVISYKVDANDEYVLDSNGNRIVDMENGLPFIVEEGGVPMQVPITYEYNNHEYVSQDVVYTLGAILEIV